MARLEITKFRCECLQARGSKRIPGAEKEMILACSGNPRDFFSVQFHAYNCLGCAG